MHLSKIICVLALALPLHAAEIVVTDSPGAGDFVLADGKTVAVIFIETNSEPAVLRATGDLVNDFAAVTGMKPDIKNNFSATEKSGIIIGTIGQSEVIDRLAAEGKLETNGVSGQWESYVWQVVKNPLPGVEKALVIAGSDRRGTIFGIYELSERIGISPWYWWADVPVAQKKFIGLRGDSFKQGPPAVKYRGIFLNDEDWGLRPWASKTFDPATGNIGPKTYAKVFELLLRLHANYLWPAMHPGSRAFNFFPEDKLIADNYGIVMGSSHCEQMLRDNVDEWDTNLFGEYNYVSNRSGVLKYWEQRVRENAKFDSIYTVGMRGIHDGAMPGGGTQREKAARLHRIIADQREMLARLVNTNLAEVPQIFCPYKEVLPLYRLMPEIPDDITLVWPDDNFGYVRQFSNAHERQRSGGAGVYYHVSYWGAPRDYLWLCSTPPALIAEEMTKAFDYGADKVWILNVGDLKPAELDIEFFLKLAWNPHSWNGTNTYDLLEKQLARDFGKKSAPEITSIMAEYYRLNFQRKPEHMGFPTNNLFSVGEAAQRLEHWQKLSARVDAVGKKLPPKSRDAFFELVAYPVKAAAAMNEKLLAGSRHAGNKIHRFTRWLRDLFHLRPRTQGSADDIQRLTDIYNNQIAGGKWHLMMSDNPRGQLDFHPAQTTNVVEPVSFKLPVPILAGTNFPGVDFAEEENVCVMEAEHASAFVPGKDANWQKISGLGYNGEAVSVFPTTVAVRADPQKILSESPCLQYKIYFQNLGDWQFTVRALPTFSVETGRPQRYAIALDDEPLQIVSLPMSMDERNRTWQENVLRNAALTTSTHTVSASGLHTLKIWMVDPGIVIDTIAAASGGDFKLGYVWPAETKIVGGR